MSLVCGQVHPRHALIAADSASQDAATGKPGPPVSKIVVVPHCSAVLAARGSFKISANIFSGCLYCGGDFDHLVQRLTAQTPTLIAELLKLEPSLDPFCEFFAVGWSPSRKCMRGVIIGNYKDEGFSVGEIKRDFYAPGSQGDHVLPTLPDVATAQDLMRCAREQHRIREALAPELLTGGNLIVARVELQHVSVWTQGAI